MVQWQLTISFAKFNAKHTSSYNDKAEAMRVGRKAAEDGIWVTHKDGAETFWAASAVARVHIELLPEVELAKVEDLKS